MKLNKENVLIVDDNYDMLELLQRNLKALNYHTYKASSVVEAISVLEESAIDLLITDLQMPGMNGLDGMRLLRQNFLHTRVVVVSASVAPDAVREARARGADGFLPKCASSTDIWDAITLALAGLALLVLLGCTAWARLSRPCASAPPSCGPTKNAACDQVDCVRYLMAPDTRLLPLTSNTSPGRKHCASACRSVGIPIWAWGRGRDRWRASSVPSE